MPERGLKRQVLQGQQRCIEAAVLNLLRLTNHLDNFVSVRGPRLRIFHFH